MAELNEKDKQEIIKQEQKAKRVNGFHVIVGMLIIMGFGILIDDGIINVGALTSNSTDNFWNLSGTSFLFPNNLNWKILFGSRADLNFDNLLKVEGDINVSGDLYVGNQTLVNTWLYNQSISPATATWNRSGTNVFLNSLGDNVGIGTTTSTHALTFPSGSTGITLYNTADQTTNYERGVISWDTNRFLIYSGKGGSGTGRVLRILSQNNLELGAADAAKIRIGDAEIALLVQNYNLGGTAVPLGNTYSKKFYIGDDAGNTGTALLPAYTVNGDANSGIFFPAADTIAISTNGTERIRIDSSGKMNLTGTTIRNTKDAISINVYANITMQSPNGVNWTCGISNAGLWSCN